VNPFRPYRLLAGGHRQTVVGYFSRRSLRWTHPTEDLVVDAGDGVRLLVRLSWQHAPESRPTVVLVHGLGGCDQSSYGVATGELAWQAGWNVARMNMRGAGDGEAICARLYNAGQDTDLVAVLHALSRRTPWLAATGFSLGANLVLLALGRSAAQLPAGLFAAAAVSPPADLAACARSLERPPNRAYLSHYVSRLCTTYRERQQRLPELYERGRELGSRTIWEFDEKVTAFYGGFRGAEDYYTQSSSGPWLLKIDRPTLILAAEDDPMIPAHAVARWPLPESGVVRREMTRTGGHVGFVAPTRAAGRFWAGERVMDFLQEAWAERRARLDGADPAA
jgi:predicted alpha/beta-fold hydrolase